MTTELQAAVHKLEGYLLAISELKADGSSFQCCCLGKIPLEEALLPLSKWLKIEENALRFFLLTILLYPVCRLLFVTGFAHAGECLKLTIDKRSTSD